MGRCQKCQNLTFKVNFLHQKLSESFLIFISLKNINSGAHFLLLTFLIASIFRSIYFLKWCPIFDTSPLTQFSNFNNFLWVCWFLGKNLSSFVPPVWKLHNPYCHIVLYIIYCQHGSHMFGLLLITNFCPLYFLWGNVSFGTCEWGTFEFFKINWNWRQLSDRYSRWNQMRWIFWQLPFLQKYLFSLPHHLDCQK